MSRTYRAPLPRRRLRAGYVARLCWRCRYPVAVCDCPARALAMAPSIEDPKLVDEAYIAAMLPDWRCACGWWCECDDATWLDAHDNAPPLTQPLAPLLRAA